jgi:hypothetical protein
MTPELSTACEVVFQQHKSSPEPINWNKDPFRGRVSMGLRDLAKDTLVRKNIICFPNPQKKVNTVLNPAVTSAGSYQEAVEIIQIGAPVLAHSGESKPAYVSMQRSEIINTTMKHTARIVRITASEMALERPKWYMKPIFYYGLWPACAAIIGILVAYALNSARF